MDDVAEDVKLDWDFLTKKHLILTGSPEHVAEQTHELDEIISLDSIALWMQYGGLSHKKIMSSIELFASEVAPLFANEK